jgi:effector-binding domain-containing protein
VWLKECLDLVEEPRMRRTGLLLLALLPLACQSTPSQPRQRTPLAGLDVQPDLAVSNPPFDEVHASWKHRIAQPYVYLEARGSYTRVGEHLGEAVRLAHEQGLEIAGPPFALYYDDPGKVASDELRMRACLPVAGPSGHKTPLVYDVLESTTVVYAFASGPYPEVPRIYPGMYAYLGELGWRENGPIRESYLVNPADVSDFSELVTEVQIPAAAAR